MIARGAAAVDLCHFLITPLCVCAGCVSVVSYCALGCVGFNLLKGEIGIRPIVFFSRLVKKNALPLVFFDTTFCLLENIVLGSDYS
jgi:hypothetical protein